MTYVADSFTTQAERGPLDVYQQLWLAVLARAFRDLETSGRQCDAVKRWALTRGHDADFIRVCDLAGLNPEYVRKHMASIIRERNEFAHAPPIDDVLLGGEPFSVDSLGVAPHIVVQRIKELQEEGYQFTRLQPGTYMRVRR